MPDTHAQPGPLKLPLTQNPEQGRIAGRLQGHSTAANWLPEGVWPELDALRAEQLRVRGQVAAEVNRLDRFAWLTRAAIRADELAI